MTLDPIEQTLARYSPPAPPPGFKDEVIEAVVSRLARRRRARFLAAGFGALLLSGVLAQVLAGSTYRQAMQLANGGSRPVPMPVMLAYAAAMGIHVPDAGTPLRSNGG
jgi:hypothetical protein